MLANIIGIINPIYIPLLPILCHSPLLDHSSYTWRRVQVMKLLFKQSSPTYHFISLGLTYSPQYPVLKYLQPVFFPECQRRNSSTTQNYRQNDNFYVFRQQTRKQKFLN
jgi:hypothetical protein